MKTILSILLCLAAMVGCTPAPVSGMDIYTFSVGKADCSLLSFDGMNVLIDVGEEDDGDDILQALRDLQVEKLNLVILTHFDKDHIGGFTELSDALPIDKVILPDYVRDSELYQRMDAALQEHQIPVERLSADFAQLLRQVFGERVLGPDTPPVGRVQQMHIRKLILKMELSAPMSAVRERLLALQEQVLQMPGYHSAQVYYDVD